MVTANEFGVDVFLSHNSRDKDAVEEFAYRLLEAGVRPWFDKWDLSPGRPWLPDIEAALGAARAVAICVGPNGLGRVQAPELEVALMNALEQKERLVVPLLLPGAPDADALPKFLARYTWVDARTDPRAAARGLRRTIFGERAQAATHLQGERPYRGLSAFDERSARYFFGRAKEAHDLLQELGTSRRFIGLVGASGSGKSSLVGAGVVPAVRSGELDGSYAWRVVSMRPGPKPCHEVAVRVTQLSGGGVGALDELEKSLLADERALSHQVDLALADDRGGDRLLLVVDQFEELFTQCSDEAERSAFLKAIAQAGSVAGGRVTVLTTIRADFLARCLEEPVLAEHARQGTFRTHLVLPMGEAALREAIVRPALLHGVSFEEGLVETLLDDARGRKAPLPLLEFVLEGLWTRRDERGLTWAAYHELGGLKGAIAQHAEQALTGSAPARLDAARTLLSRLVTIDDQQQPARRRALRAEVSLDEEPVLEQLVTERLVIADGDSIEIAHEVLLEEWAQLRRWIDDDRVFLAWRLRLDRQIADWEASAPHGGLPDDDLLLRGRSLVAAVEWTRSHDDRLSEAQRAYVRASVQRDERLAAAATRRRRAAVWTIGATALVMAVLVVVSASQSRRAVRATRQAEARAVALAESTRKEQQRRWDTLEDQGRRELVDGHPLQALVFLGTAYSEGARGYALPIMLHRAARWMDALKLSVDVELPPAFEQDEQDARVTPAADDDEKAQARNFARALTNLSAVYLRSMSTFTVSASSDRFVTIGHRADVWTSSGTHLATIHEPDPYWSASGGASLSRDGRQIATWAGSKAPARIWSAEDGHLIRELPHGDRVEFVGEQAFLAAEHRITAYDVATWSELGHVDSPDEMSDLRAQARVDGAVTALSTKPGVVAWSWKNGQPTAIPVPKQHVDALELGARGTLLVTERNHEHQVWSLGSPAVVLLATVHRPGSFVVSPNAELVAFRDGDEVTLADARHIDDPTATPVRARRFGPGVDGLRFNQDGSILAVTSKDKVQLVNPNTGTEEDAVDVPSMREVQFVGSTLLILSEAHVYGFDLTSVFDRRLPFAEGSRGAKFCGPSLVGTVSDGVVTLEGVEDGHQVAVIALDGGHKIEGFLCDAGGRALVSRAEVGELARWNPTDGHFVSALSIEGGTVDERFSVNGDGSRLVVRPNATANVSAWDVAGKKPLKQFAPGEAVSNNWTFSVDGRFLLTRAQRAWLLWDLTTGRKVATLEARELDAAVAPGGRWIGEGSSTGYRLRETTTGATYQLPPTPIARSGEFSPNGAWLVVPGMQDSTQEKFSSFSERSLIWDLSSMKRVGMVPDLAGDDGTILPDSRMVVARGSTSLTVCELPSGRPLIRTGWPDLESTFQISPDGRWLLSKRSGARGVFDLRAESRSSEEVATLLRRAPFELRDGAAVKRARVENAATKAPADTAAEAAVLSQLGVDIAGTAGVSYLKEAVDVLDKRRLAAKEPAAVTDANDALGDALQNLASEQSGGEVRTTLERAAVVRKTAAESCARAGGEARWRSLQSKLGVVLMYLAQTIEGDRKVTLQRQALTALSAAADGAQRDQQWSQARAGAMEVYADMEQWDESLRAANDVLSFDPKSARAMELENGIFHDHLFRFEDARAVAERRVAQYPTDESALADLTEAEFTAGQYHRTLELSGNLLNNPKTRPSLRPALAALALAATVGSGAVGAGRKQARDALKRELNLAATDKIALTWRFDGTSHYIRATSSFARDSEQLVGLLDAVGANRISQALSISDTL